MAGVLSFKDAEHLIFTVKNGITFYEFINNYLDNSFDLEDLRMVIGFDDSSDKITFDNPDISSSKITDPKMIPVVDLAGKNAYVGMTISHEINPEKQIVDMMRMAELAVTKKAEKVSLIAPYLYYSRQDGLSSDFERDYKAGMFPNPDSKQFKKCKQRINSTDDLKVIVKHAMLSGIEAIISADLHNEADVLRFAQDVNKKYHLKQDMDRFLFNIDTLPIFVHHIRYGLPRLSDTSISLDNIVFVSPDEGAAEKTQRAISLLGDSGVGHVLCSKSKEQGENGYTYKVTVKEAINVKDLVGKILIFIDDCAGSFNTLNDAKKALVKEFGSPAYVLAFVTHPTIYKDDAFKKIREESFNVITTNTRPNMSYHRGRDYNSISTLNIAPYFYNVMTRCIGTPGSEIKPFNEVFNFTAENLKTVSSLYQVGVEDFVQKKLIPHNH